jgi:uncharacterized protein YbaA (DUF1428 family)
MAYFDGFVIPVPTANKDQFIAHARLGDPVFIEKGAVRVVECWAEDVSHGKVTDFYGAVDAKEGESIVFSWIEWPDKATRDQGMAAMMDTDNPDPRMDPAKNPAPFDGKRMIYGGFEPLVIEGDLSALPYVQGFIVPVPHAKREEYRAVARDAWEKVFRPYGALCVLEAWGDDVPNGEVTDFYRAGKATGDENAVFSFMAWPSREACDAAAERMQSDPNMQMPEGGMPFDGMRMIYGGFVPVVKLGD